MHGKVIRPYSHSLSDDEKLYRPDAERQKDAQRDPITRMQMFLIRENILDENGINKLEKQVGEEIQEATDRVNAIKMLNDQLVHDNADKGGQLAAKQLEVDKAQAATQVASPGPPWVIARISSNTAKAKAVRRIRMMAMICCSIGSVIWRKRCQALAPSIEACS